MSAYLRTRWSVVIIGVFALQGDITGFSSPTFSRHGDMRRQSITDDAMMDIVDGTSSPSLRRASCDVMSPTLCREASLDVFVAPAQVRSVPIYQYCFSIHLFAFEFGRRPYLSRIAC